MINPVRLARNEPISQYSSVYGCWLDEYPCIRGAWFMTWTDCWLSYRSGCWLFSWIACADIGRQSDMTHANTMFLGYDLIIYFHVFVFIFLSIKNIQQNYIVGIDAGQNNDAHSTSPGWKRCPAPPLLIQWLTCPSAVRKQRSAIERAGDDIVTSRKKKKALLLTHMIR